MQRLMFELSNPRLFTLRGEFNAIALLDPNKNDEGKIEQNLHDIDFLVSDPLGHFLSLLSSQTPFLLSHILFLSQTHTILIYLPSRKLIESVGPDHKTHLKE